MMTYDFTSAENKVIIHINQGLILGDTTMTVPVC